jgi:S-adenosylmethionine hydrolase
MAHRVIALLTDFGCRDVYAGVMKAVIVRIAPAARLLDLTHDIPPGDLRAGAFSLWQAARFLPLRSILLAVIDPGVGGARRPVAVRFPSFTYVGPDNGLLTYVLGSRPDFHAVELSSPAFRLDSVSSTFHGRDIFAPAAAHLAAGIHLRRLGPNVSDLCLLPLPKLGLMEEDKAPSGVGAPGTSGTVMDMGANVRPGSANRSPRVSGEVLHADRFGNIVTSIGLLYRDGAMVTLEPWLPLAPENRQDGLQRRATVWAAEALRAALTDGTRIALKGTYSDVSAGEPLAYIGSDGLLEIAVNGGRVDERFSLSPGVKISLGD